MNNPPSDDDTGLLVEVAKLYYEEQLTQAQIGRQLQTSRSTVSRLLKEARDQGVVKITIQYKWVRDSALERDLAKMLSVWSRRSCSAPTGAPKPRP